MSQIVDLIPGLADVLAEGSEARFGPIEVDMDPGISEAIGQLQDVLHPDPPFIGLPTQTIQTIPGLSDATADGFSIDQGDTEIDLGVQAPRSEVRADDFIVIWDPNDQNIFLQSGAIDVVAIEFEPRTGPVGPALASGAVDVFGDLGADAPNLNAIIHRWSYPMIVVDFDQYVETEDPAQAVLRRMQSDDGKRRWLLRLGTATGSETDSLQQFWQIVGGGGGAFQFQPPDETVVYRCRFGQNSLEINRQTPASGSITQVTIEEI